MCSGWSDVAVYLYIGFSESIVHTPCSYPESRNVLSDTQIYDFGVMFWTRDLPQNYCNEHLVVLEKMRKCSHAICVIELSLIKRKKKTLSPLVKWSTKLKLPCSHQLLGFGSSSTAWRHSSDPENEKQEKRMQVQYMMKQNEAWGVIAPFAKNTCTVCSVMDQAIPGNNLVLWKLTVILQIQFKNWRADKKMKSACRFSSFLGESEITLKKTSSLK